MDIREEIHSHASPANLHMVRAYLTYLERGDASDLRELWLAQTIPVHDAKLAAAPDPGGLKAKLIDTARELETILARIYGFESESLESVLRELDVWLKAVGPAAPAAAAAAMDACRKGDCKSVAMLLAQTRQSLVETMASTASPDEGLRLLYLDIELEKLGYIIFGDIANSDLAQICEGNLKDVMQTFRAMIISESAKGRDTPRLRSVAGVLKEFTHEREERLAGLMALDHQINDEIADLSSAQYREYHAIARGILAQCDVPDIDIAANRFVDGLIRGTTLQHMGELSMRVYHFVLNQLEAMGEEESGRVRALVEKYHRRYETRAASDARTPMLICRFRPGNCETRDFSPEILGSKGANLCAMCLLGIPVPPGREDGLRGSLASAARCTGGRPDSYHARPRRPPVREGYRQDPGSRHRNCGVRGRSREA